MGLLEHLVVVGRYIAGSLEGGALPHPNGTLFTAFSAESRWLLLGSDLGPWELHHQNRPDGSLVVSASEALLKCSAEQPNHPVS